LITPAQPDGLLSAFDGQPGGGRCRSRRQE
jgi:hypothetical protein